MSIIEILFYGIIIGILTFVINERPINWSVQRLFLNLFSGIAIMFALIYYHYKGESLSGFFLLLIVVFVNMTFKNNESKT